MLAWLLKQWYETMVTQTNIKAMVTRDMVRVSGMEKPPTTNSVMQHAN